MNSIFGAQVFAARRAALSRKFYSKWALSLFALFFPFLFLFFLAATNPLCGVAQPGSTTKTLVLQDGTLVLCSFPTATFAVSDTVVLRWIEENACAVRTYYGRFPVQRFRLTLRPRFGESHIEYGNARQGSPPHISIYIGVKADKSEFQRSWILAHEMLHLAFPSLDEPHRWLEEGIATFIEPLARAMTGLVSEESVWKEFVENMERGAFAPAGLDGSTSPGRVYWGGALFCLLADIEIRRATHNQKSLRDALRVILEREGSINDDRSITTVLRSADKALGVQTLQTLYQKMGKRAFALADTLSALWSQLGVEYRPDSTVHLNQAAPLAAFRQSMTRVSHPCAGVPLK
jgi:hypothetical protein